MKARNVTTADIVEIVYSLNDQKYNGNLAIEKISQENNTTVSFKMGTRDNRTVGSRRSW